MQAHPILHRSALALTIALMALPLAGQAQGRWSAWRGQTLTRPAANDGLEDASARDAQPWTVPAGVRVVRNLAYGPDPLQRVDVYLPTGSVAHAPVLVMVHGGGWRRGDKALASVVQNKVGHWVPQGVIVVSVNYRLLPTAVIDQARDVAHALAFVQHHATAWGGDPQTVALMGHSAGAHLVSLVSSRTDLQAEANVTPWLGTISLDSAAVNVPALMSSPHLPLYDAAFGSQPATWYADSPLQQVHHRLAPVLAVCSSQRRTSCSEAQAFVNQIQRYGGRGRVAPEAMSHRQINEDLGLPSAYTQQVDAFLHGLSPAFP